MPLKKRLSAVTMQPQKMSEKVKPEHMTVEASSTGDGGAAGDRGAVSDIVCAGNATTVVDGGAEGHGGAAADHPLIISTCDLRDFLVVRLGR
jgi:hypothetical protein